MNDSTIELTGCGGQREHTTARGEWPTIGVEGDCTRGSTVRSDNEHMWAMSPTSHCQGQAAARRALQSHQPTWLLKRSPAGTRVSPKHSLQSTQPTPFVATSPPHVESARNLPWWAADSERSVLFCSVLFCSLLLPGWTSSPSRHSRAVAPRWMSF